MSEATIECIDLVTGVSRTVTLNPGKLPPFFYLVADSFYGVKAPHATYVHTKLPYDNIKTYEKHLQFQLEYDEHGVAHYILIP